MRNTIDCIERVNIGKLASPWIKLCHGLVKMRIISETHPSFCNRRWQSAWTLLSFMKKQQGINCKNKSTDKMQMHFFVLNYYLMEVDGGPHASLYVYSIWYPIVLNVILNINLGWFTIHKTNLKCNFLTSNHVLTTPQWQFSVSGHNWKDHHFFSFPAISFPKRIASVAEFDPTSELVDSLLPPLPLPELCEENVIRKYSHLILFHPPPPPQSDMWPMFDGVAQYPRKDPSGIFSLRALSF